MYCIALNDHKPVADDSRRETWYKHDCELTVSLNWQKDIPGNSPLQTQPIPLTTRNIYTCIIVVTKERFLNNTLYYQTMLSLLLNLSHHWHELTTNLRVTKENSLWSTWPWAKFLNNLYNSVTAKNNHNSYIFSTWSPLRQSTTTAEKVHNQESPTTTTPYGLIYLADSIYTFN